MASADLGHDLPSRREALRRVALAGLLGGGVAGVAALSARALDRNWRDEASNAGLASVTHQLGWLKGVQFGGCFMAQEKGYFARERLAVSYAAGGPTTDYRTLVSSGRFLVSESDASELIYARIQGQPLVAFAAVFQRSPAAFMSPAARPIRSLRDMVGRTIGVPNVVLARLQILMRRQRIDPETINFVPVGTDASMLVSGQIDAYYSFATTAVPTLRLRGFEPHVLYLSDMGMPDYAQALIARRDQVENDPDLFVRYTRALIGGWQAMMADPAQAAAVIVEKYALPGTDIREQVIQARMLRDFVLVGDALDHGPLWIAAPQFETALRFARDAGVLPEGFKIDVESLLTQSIVKAAASRPEAVA